MKLKVIHHGRVRGAEDGGDDERGGADGKSQSAQGLHKNFQFLVAFIYDTWQGDFILNELFTFS